MFKKLMGWLGWTVLAVILGTVGFVLGAVRQGWQFDAVLSGSMEPVYHVGGIAVFRPIETSAIEVGDIIAFKLPKVRTPICHRVIEIVHESGSTYFLTKGDANEDADQDHILPEYVQGKGILHIPYVGRLADVSKVGRERVYFLGKGFPKATVVIFCMGLLFVGLTFKDTIEEVFFPAKRWRKDALKKRKAALLKRRRAWGRG